METSIDGTNINARLDKNLALYAQKHSDSAGRRYTETHDPERSPFQRDRDRILHATAFRRLKGKMQVVSPDAGDHFRNRLTHTLEVAQIARDISRQLRLNEDLTETIALSHDLGHPPFGHSGESALRERMEPFGKTFEHNMQSLRIVEYFEVRYPGFLGLNLTQEVREGLQKHSSNFIRPGEKNPRIFSPHLEAQVVDISDAIAYTSADLEDGLRGGFFTLDDLRGLKIFQDVFAQLPENEHQFRPSVIRGIMRKLIRRLLADTQKNLETKNIQSLADVQQSQSKIVQFSAEFYPEIRELKEFLMARFYRSPAVTKATDQGKKIVAELFQFLLKNPEQIKHRRESDPIEVQVCDFIAGMTDQFATDFWEKHV